MAASVKSSETTLAADTPVALFPVSLATGLGANKDQYVGELL